MLLTKAEVERLLTFERMLEMYSMFTDAEKDALKRWEDLNLGHGSSTSDWGGWTQALNRLAPSKT